jgi:radical SAM superfamily enzyme YgiQ (UPF0313 family)
MRVLLVYPEFPDTFWSFKHALRFIRRKASFPPLGLLTISSLLPQEWERRLVDMNVAPLTRHDLEWADYVFISAMTLQRDSVHRVVERCVEVGAKMVAGGPLFLGEHADFPEIDHFVLGEGEVTLPLFLADLERGEPQRLYESSEFPDITQSPIPDWSLVDLHQYSSMCVQYSRGCPFNCDFCNITAMFGHRPRIKTAPQIIAELDSLYATGWRDGVFFVDDNFIGNKRHLKEEMLPALIEWRKGKRGMGFQTEVSVNLADDDELMRLMVAAGFDRVFVGIETPDENSLEECSKRQNKGRDLISTVKTMQHAGLEVQGGFIVGFDSDTPSIFERQIEFIQKSGIVTAMVGLLQAPYGTRLYDRMKEEGRLLDEFTGNNTDNSMNFEPVMDPKMLHEGYEHILLTIYSPRAYYQRVRTLLQEYNLPRVVKPVLNWNYLGAFFKSIFTLGLKGQERLEYWKLFFWTLFRRPRLFPLAITLAIYGFHFQRICETYVGHPESGVA